jgi:hypothetical protein
VRAGAGFGHAVPLNDPAADPVLAQLSDLGTERRAAPLSTNRKLDGSDWLARIAMAERPPDDLASPKRLPTDRAAVNSRRS